MRADRFFLKTAPSGGEVIDEIRLIADLETGSLDSASTVHMELQEIRTSPCVQEPGKPDCMIRKSKMISLEMSTGSVVRPRCGSVPSEVVDGESIYSERGEFTILAAECIDEFGGDPLFNAPFLFRVTGELPIICQDGFDNDGDGFIDLVDLGCMDEFDLTEEFSCEDGLDDDGDGLVDYPEDPGCSSGEDDSEKDPLLECDDGKDNDDDGKVDFPDDPECLSPLTVTEAPEPTLLLLQASALFALAALRRQRR